MGLLPIILASMLTSRRGGEHSSDPEDPEKAQRRQEPTTNGDGDDDEQETRDIEDDNESSHDSDPQDTDEDEPEEPSPPERRVTFGGPSEEDNPPSEDTDGKPGLLSRLKAIVFPSEDENESRSNYRLLPIISGLVIPFSILLEIPSLTDSWYIRTDAGAVVESRRKPALLEAGLAISMFFAIVANGSLICRFLEKGSVLTTTLTTIASLTIHDAINIIALVVFGVLHRFDDGFTYGQGFWMTACSTIVSTATNISLIWDMVRTRNFMHRGSGVTRRQRSLLIIVMILLLYIAFGALVNSFLINLDFINGLYFTVVSIETVGFGDIVPDNTGSRVFICFYIVFGIINLGVAVGVARETIFEQLQISYQERLAKIRQNHQEHRRWRTWERKWKRAVEWRLNEIPAEVWIQDLEGDTASVMDRAKERSKWAPILVITRVFHTSFHTDEHHKFFREKGEIRGLIYGHPGTHLNVEALSQAQLEAAAAESGIPQCVLRALRSRRPTTSGAPSISSESTASIRQRWRRWFLSRDEPLPTEPSATPFMRGLEDMTGMLTKFALATTGVGMNRMPYWANSGTRDIHQGRSLALHSSLSEPTTLSEGPRFTTNDDLREITKQEERKALWAKLVVAWLFFMVFWLVGAALFVATEKWTFGIAVYFCFVTFTTTGYGDYAPKTAAGRSVFVFWALLGLATMTILVSVLQDAFSSRYKHALHSGVFEKAVKKYRQKTKAQNEKNPEEVNEKLNISGRVRTSVVEESTARAQQSLENLPGHVLDQTRVFHRHIRRFIQSEPEGVVTPDLKLMLDDISRTHKLDDRMKDEILQDEDARNTLHMLSFERSLGELVDIAENTLSALAEREILANRYREQQQVGVRENTGDEASGSGACKHDTLHDSDIS